MKNIYLILNLIILLSSSLFSQEKDYSLSKTAKVIQGVYVFIGSTPYHPYDVIDKWEVYWNKDGNPDEKLLEAITRCRKKYNNVDGIVFKKLLINKTLIYKSINLQMEKK